VLTVVTVVTVIVTILCPAHLFDESCSSVCGLFFEKRTTEIMQSQRLIFDRCAGKKRNRKTPAETYFGSAEKT
jgi:hypothetical protein